MLTLAVPEPGCFELGSTSRLRQQVALTGRDRSVILPGARWAAVDPDSVAPSPLRTATGRARPVKVGGQATRKLA